MTEQAGPTDYSKQPKSLYMLFFAEMWERFSFYGMRALLTLYMTKTLFESMGDKEKEAQAFGIYAAYGALVYATPFIGGIIADKVLGNKKAVIFGAIMMSIGHFVMAVENEFWLYVALAFLIVGNGAFKPNISSMVGGLYDDDDPRRDGGFTIFYMGINLGAMLAPLLCGYLGEEYGWFWGFGLAGLGMIAGLIVFGFGQGELGTNGDPPNPEMLQKKYGGISVENLVYIAGTISVILFALLVQNYEVMSMVLSPFALLVLGILFATAIFSPTKEERERLFVILILLFFTTLFWAFFEQAGSSLTLFTKGNVDRNIFGWEVSTSLFQSVNPAFILLLGPLFSRLWISLAKKGKEPSAPVKFALGLLQLGLGFLVLNLGVSFIDVSDDSINMPMFFLLALYFLHTTGELCLSPIGLSMVTKLSPKRITAMVMGAWFLSSAMAHHIGGYIAILTTGGTREGVESGKAAVEAGLIESAAGKSEEVLQSADKLANYLDIFGILGYTAIAASVLLIAISPLLKRWMHGVK